ncbi:hypothetical protein U6Y84_12345, partial [Cutibacterium acnes]
IFRRELYASVSFLAAGFYLGCVYFKVPGEQAILLTLFGGLLLRLLAIRFRWEMPKFQYNDEH